MWWSMNLLTTSHMCVVNKESSSISESHSEIPETPRPWRWLDQLKVGEMGSLLTNLSLVRYNLDHSYQKQSFLWSYKASFPPERILLETCQERCRFTWQGFSLSNLGIAQLYELMIRLEMPLSVCHCYPKCPWWVEPIQKFCAIASSNWVEA